MCEWCERLVFMPVRWNRHAFPRAWKFCIPNSKWNRDKWLRLDWRRAQKWCDKHVRRVDLGKRLYGNGYGDRFYERRI